jgi:hypothetical protein
MALVAPHSDLIFPNTLGKTSKDAESGQQNGGISFDVLMVVVLQQPIYKSLR